MQRLLESKFMKQSNYSGIRLFIITDHLRAIFGVLVCLINWFRLTNPLNNHNQKQKGGAMSNLVKHLKNGVIGIVLFSSLSVAQGRGSVEPFLGRWALFLPGGAGWLEVRQENGYIDADILWYGGSVVPADNVYLNGETLVVTLNRKVVRGKDDKGEPTRTQVATIWLEFSLYGDLLVGTHNEPNKNGIGVKITKFTGKKIPPLPPAPDLAKLKYGEPIKLFNGEDLTGWTLTDSRSKNGWKVENGVLINDPVQKEGQPHVYYGNLRTVAEFEDFNLKLEVNVPKGNNSGIYLRGIYEVQVLDSYGKAPDSHYMGAIYSRITPSVSAEKPGGQWQSLDITLCDRHVNVLLNGKTIIDNQPLLGVTGGALTADEFSPGPIYLQGDHGKVLYRNIVLTPIIK